MAESIETLSGYGFGQEAICIGGGESVKTLAWDSLPDDLIRIQCNFPYHGKPVDYLIYWDNVVMSEINKYGTTSQVICRNLGEIPERAEYYYDSEKMPMFDTGLNALFFASEILRCKTVYLIGYDYKGGHYHDVYQNTNVERWFKLAPGKYEREWSAKVYNLNEDSNVTFFEKIKKYVSEE